MAFGDTIQIADVSFLAVDFTINFSAATPGNLLVISEGRAAPMTAGGAWGAPTGWNILHSSPINSGFMAGAAYWKIAAGGETSATSIHTNIGGNGHVAFAEIEGPFAVSPLDVQAENETKLSTVGTSVSTGTTGTTAQNDELALAFFASDAFQTIDGSRAYTNSFTEVAIGDNTAARATGWIAKLVLSATGTVECTFSCTDTGDEMYGQIATFKKAASGHADLVAVQGSYALSGQAAGLLKASKLTAVQGSYALTGQTAGLFKGFSLVAVQGSYALTGQTAGLSKASQLAAVQGSYVLSGQSAGLFWARVLAAAQGAYNLAGQDAALTYSGTAHPDLVAAFGAYVLTGRAAGLLATHSLTAVQGNYALSGQAANLLVSRRLTAAQGSYLLTGQPANLLVGRFLLAAQGNYALTGQAANFVFLHVLLATVGLYNLMGQDANLIYSGQAVTLEDVFRGMFRGMYRGQR